MLGRIYATHLLAGKGPQNFTQQGRNETKYFTILTQDEIVLISRGGLQGQRRVAFEDAADVPRLGRSTLGCAFIVYYEDFLRLLYGIFGVSTICIRFHSH